MVVGEAITTDPTGPAAAEITAEDALALGMREQGMEVMTDAIETDGSSIAYHFPEGFAAPELAPVQGPFAIEPDEWRAALANGDLEAAVTLAPAAALGKGAGWLAVLAALALLA